MDNLIERIEIPANVRVMTGMSPTVLEIYSDHIKTYGGRESSWFFDDFTGATMQRASILCAYASIIMLNAQSAQWNFKNDMAMMQDRNRINFCSGMFKYKPANEFVASLLPKIQNAIEQYKSNPCQNNTSASSSADELRKYKELLDDGIITQEEFDKKKEQLLK